MLTAMAFMNNHLMVWVGFVEDNTEYKFSTMVVLIHKRKGSTRVSSECQTITATALDQILLQ